MEGSDSQNATVNDQPIRQEQAASVVVQPQLVYREGFWTRLKKDKQKLLLLICSVSLLVGLVNSVLIISSFRRNRERPVMMNGGMMMPGMGVFGGQGMPYREFRDKSRSNDLPSNQPESGTQDSPVTGQVQPSIN